MLKGISPLVSPDLLKMLSEMGHGDEIVIGDAHFPAATFAEKRCLRADGIKIPDLLRAILPLLELDRYVDSPVVTMEAVPGDRLDPKVERSYRKALDDCGCKWAKMSRMERFAFYERAKKAYVIVQSGDTAIYANIILKKGVTPVG